MVLRSKACLLAVIFMAGSAAALAAVPTVMPPPRKLEAGDDLRRLPAEISIAITARASDTEQYAAEQLQKDLGNAFGVTPPIVRDAKGATIVLGIPATSLEMTELLRAERREALESMPRTEGFLSEGYIIDVIGEGKQTQVLVAGTDRVGVMYGCFTLSQLFTKREGRLHLPQPLRVEDYPVMKRRGYAFYTDDIERLDWMARWRLNALGYRQYWPWPGPWTEDIRENVPTILAECRRRGITYYAGTAQRWVQDYLKKHPDEYDGVTFSIEDARCVNLMENLWSQLGSVGVDGFLLMLDDIPRNVSATDLGREHVQWVRMMKDAGQRYGIPRLLMCPTYYWKGWDPEYYRQFKEATDLADVDMFFCPFDEGEITRASEAGLQNYEWWHNGTYSVGNQTLSFLGGLQGGFVRVEWGWYGNYECSPELLRELRTVPDRTLCGWINGDWPMWGSYTWNPRIYEPEKYERAMAEVQLGGGIGETYVEMMEHIRGWAQKLQTTEGAPQDFEAANAEAKEKLDAMKLIIDQTERPGVIPAEKRRNLWWLIDKDLRALDERAYRPFVVLDAREGEETVEVRATCRRQNVTMRYTLDGSRPTASSPVWTKPLRLDHSATVRVTVFRGDEEKSSASAVLHKHDANGRPVDYVNAWSAKYPAGGDTGLTDGIRGSERLGDGCWQGFEVDDLDATIDLGRPVAVHNVRAGFLQAAGSWVFLPTEVEFGVSQDGENFEVLKHFENTISPNKPGSFIEEYSVSTEPKEVRYIRVRAKNIGHCPDGHGHKGEDAWLFIDEVLVNSDESDAGQPTAKEENTAMSETEPLRGYTIPLVDLDADTNRQVVVDREDGQYLGHPTTVLLDDNKTMICVYPKGHGRGAIVMKRSEDAGLTWSERLPVPETWATSKEVPTIYPVEDPQGAKRLIMFSGLYPIRMAVSEDEGKTWSELEPIGDFGGIVAMGDLIRLKDGSYMAGFHDDGRFLHDGGETAGGMRVFKTLSRDGGLTWSAPEQIVYHPDAGLCEPGFVRSPDGKQIAMLMRENYRKFNAMVSFSDDEGETWSEPLEMPGALTGDRHQALYAPDGRLFLSFRDTTHDSPTKGDWVGWVGRYEDIVEGREGQYRVRLKENHRGGDCAYPALELLPDGTIVATTYGHWTEGEEPYILSVRFRMEELDEIAAE